MPRTKKQSSEAAVREIRRRTRRKFAPEEKIRIVLDDFSRYIIAWKLSPTMGATDVTETLDPAW